MKILLSLLFDAAVSFEHPFHSGDDCILHCRNGIVEHLRQLTDNLGNSFPHGHANKMQRVSSQFSDFGPAVGLGRVTIVVVPQVRLAELRFVEVFLSQLGMCCCSQICYFTDGLRARSKMLSVQSFSSISKYWI